MKGDLNLADVAWWREKLLRGAENRKHGGPRGFGAVSARHALRIFDALMAAPSHRLDAPDIRRFATLVDMPSKFVPRAVAMLARSGIVQAKLVPQRIREIAA